MRSTLEQVAAVLGVAAPSQATITGWSIDTRTLVPGDLFFAIGAGNAYVDQAFAKGAAGVVAEQTAPGPVLTVPDALLALQQLAASAREQWSGDVVGVTGSVGKTSTKDVIASLLEIGLRVGKTIGNYNNHLGLPLSILRLPPDAQVAVLELGMNHAGEIRHLASIARPNVAVVTMVGYAHIEFFDSIEDIAAAKRELVEALPPDGVAVLNVDDPRVCRFAAVHPGRTVTYGFRKGAEVRGEDLELLPDRTRFRLKSVIFETKLTGRHSVRNILAGIAVAGLYGLAPERLTSTVAELQPARMRGERTWYQGVDLLNDCYNSSPDAARSMIDVLRDTPAKRRIAVLGEMLELGRWSEPLHRDIGRYAAEGGIDVLVGIRGAAKSMVDAAILAGLPASAAYFFEDSAEAGSHLRNIARSGDAILFKGSRGTHVERALEAFTSQERS